ncbi:hypothetical protein GCM10023196_018780 [Actinoallomurus vinaceus]|uniref:Uncharacterized protein n=1 Tax=Actinoallomurus vinaceus TaxID=1080074 RepID=A0ABP8U7G0_9ACTN
MTDRTGRAAAWIGRPMTELTDEELAEFAEWLAGERPADDPMLIAVQRLRRERMPDEEWELRGARGRRGEQRTR